MTLPTAGKIGFANVNSERGAAANAAMSLGWVQGNSFYAYKNLGSIKGLTWFTAVSSQNSVARTTANTTTNCANAVSTVQTNTKRYTGTKTNCNKRINTNCDQCGYNHGTYLQMNCNCNCNCAACNCDYRACNCVSATCTCTCTCGGTCGGNNGTCSTCSACACTAGCTCGPGPGTCTPCS